MKMTKKSAVLASVLATTIAGLSPADGPGGTGQRRCRRTGFAHADAD